ncbi:MAG: putative bifunctional diguanylate cyclase/phosphodiesterase [Caulobacterales bacterium]
MKLQPLDWVPDYSVMRRIGEMARWRLGAMSLAGRICLLVAALLSAVSIVFTAAIWSAWRAESRAHVEILGGELARAIAPRLAEAINQNDQGRIKRLTDTVDGAPGVVWSEVVGADGRRLSGYGDPPAGPRPTAIDALTVTVTSDAYIAATPIIGPNGRVGAIRVGYDRAAIEATHANRFGALWIIVLAIIGVAAPATFWVVSRMMAPLAQLTDFAQALTEDDLGRRIDIRTNDEFAALANAFNLMMGRLDTAMQRMRKLAYVDPVTELPNAERFQIDLQNVLEVDQDGEPLSALVVLALDRLPRLADTLGQEAAQELLALAGQRLAAAVRIADRTVRLADAGERPSVAARISNTEFAVLAPTLASAADASRIAQVAASALSQPVGWRGHRISFGCTVGAAILPRDGADADTALRHARLALNAARGEQRQMRFFTRSLDNDAHARLTLEREMREALERSEFRAYFQPKVDLLSGKITGAEALARWTRPDGSIVSPMVFIPAAEENGLIDAISDAILRDACWKAAAWAREGLPAHVAVNISSLQFNDLRFAQKILRTLEQSGLESRLLQLEVTESVAMKDVDRVASLIEPLRARGVQFAIDDFGTGHSSLAALTHLPFDLLKIDQQFIRGLAEDRHAPAIVETILAMAASVNYDTVAEGVETEEQAAFLRLRGCATAQGYLYGPALPPADFLALLRRNKQGVAADLDGKGAVA